MILQRIWGSLGSLYLKRPNILANWFDAKGYRIANLGKPKRDSDAVDLGTLKSEVSNVSEVILKKEKRTLRVDDIDIASFPKAQERRNKQIGFDSSGIPTLLDPAETGVLGYAPVDSFEKGATLTSRYQVLFWEEKREYFRWDGKLPKVVPPNSTPNETGGIRSEDNRLGLWVDVGDASLRGELNNKNYRTVSEMISSIKEFNLIAG
ncbi:phage tail protein, partial [Providencia rettgeri]